MRQLESLDQNEMYCNESDKYINGEEVGDGDQLGNVNNGANAADDENGEARGGRVPEQINDNEFEDEDVDDYDLTDMDFGNEEFTALNSALDELQGALDTLESRNDGIHQELLQLLQSNREMRSSLIEGISNMSEESNGEIIDLSGAASSAGNVIPNTTENEHSEIPNLSKFTDLNSTRLTRHNHQANFATNMAPG